MRDAPSYWTRAAAPHLWEHISLFDPVYPILLLFSKSTLINGGGNLKTTSVSQEHSRHWTELSHLTSQNKTPGTAYTRQREDPLPQRWIKELQHNHS